MRFTVEPSPAGGFHVRVEGVSAPLSHHDTEDEANARRQAYERGAGEPARGELVDLPDGSEVLVRPVQPEDKPLFVAGWQHFGEESRYRRFLGAKGDLTARDLAYFTEVDHVDHEAIGARDAESGAGVGVARYVRLPEQPTVAEAAVSVVDAWQGRGLGGLLLRRLCHRAAQNGIRVFTAGLLASNHSMLHLFEKLGTVHVTEREGPELFIAVELQVSDAPTLELALRSAATGHIGLDSRRDGGAELGRGR